MRPWNTSERRGSTDSRGRSGPADDAAPRTRRARMEAAPSSRGTTAPRGRRRRAAAAARRPVGDDYRRVVVLQVVFGAQTQGGGGLHGSTVTHSSGTNDTTKKSGT